MQQQSVELVSPVAGREVASSPSVPSTNHAFFDSIRDSRGWKITKIMSLLLPAFTLSFAFLLSVKLSLMLTVVMPLLGLALLHTILLISFERADKNSIFRGPGFRGLGDFLYTATTAAALALLLFAPVLAPFVVGKLGVVLSVISTILLGLSLVAALYKSVQYRRDEAGSEKTAGNGDGALQISTFGPVAQPTKDHQPSEQALPGYAPPIQLASDQANLDASL